MKGESSLKREELSIWEVNIQLAVLSMILYSGKLLTIESVDNIQTTLMIALISSMGGIINAGVLKFASSLHKCFSNAGALVLTTFLAWRLQGGPMGLETIVGSTFVSLAVIFYNLPVKNIEENYDIIDSPSSIDESEDTN